MTFLLLAACSENNLVKAGEDPAGSASDAAPDILVEPTAVDFGLLAWGDSGTAAVTITNAGDAALSLADLSLEVDAGDVTWSSLSTPSVPPGGSIQTTLTWTPFGPGRLSDTLRVDSDDPDEPRVEVPLTGRLPYGELQVDPPTYDFGTLEVGDLASATITVSNVGDGPLTISSLDWTPSDADMALADAGQLTATPAVLGPGEAAEVTITYSPSAAGPDEGSLLITSDDPTTPTEGAQLFGAGEEDDPCDGFTQTVDLMLTADDQWEGWIDGTAFSGPNQYAWNAFDTFTWEMECGDHALSLYARDSGMVIAGVIAVVWVEGSVRFVSESANWRMTDTSPGTGWTDPSFDDSAWNIPQPCSDLSPWGSTPQPFYDYGAQWIWWTTDCRDLGEAWLRLNFTVP